MSFLGQPFAYDSPAAAVTGMLRALDSGHGCLGGRAGSCRAVESCDLNAARGRVLAVPAVTDRDNPPFDHSAMDGYAIRAGDLAAAAVSPASEDLVFPVTGESRIGRQPPGTPPLKCAIRISTGAPIPAGLDTILKREDVIESLDGDTGSISVPGPIARSSHAGQHIRRRAENARTGQTILDAGSVLSAAGVGALAAVGTTRPSVYTRVRVALITTGDELVPISTIPSNYQIRNSSAHALAALMSAHAWLEPVSTQHVRDEHDALVSTINNALDTTEAVVMTGGVSMGHRDPVRAALESLRARLVFHGLPQRPGKPMLGAVLRGREGPVPLLALPGNPVSALVTCQRIALPILAAVAGICCPSPEAGWPLRVRLVNPDGQQLPLWWHRLVRVTADGNATLLDSRGSGDLVAAGRADGFIELPPNATGTSGTNDVFPFYSWPV